MNDQVDLFEANSDGWKNVYKGETNLDQSYKEEWLHFIECVNKKERPMISFQDGVEVLNSVDSIKDASSSGKRVKVK